jgi:hypothetical protein
LFPQNSSGNRQTGKNKPKTPVDAAVDRKVPVPERATEVHWTAVVTRAPTQHAGFTLFRSHRIDRIPFRICAIPIPAPLPHVSSHVKNALLRSAGGKNTNWRWMSDTRFTPIRMISVNVQTFLGVPLVLLILAPGGPLPLGLGGQRHLDPSAKRRCL